MEEIQFDDIPHVDSMKERLAKMLIVSTVGFITTSLTEKLVENVLANRRRNRL